MKTMTPNFLLLKVECVNSDMNAPCKIILDEIKDGLIFSEHIFMINPGDVPFNFTVSGLQLADLLHCKEFPDIWNEIDSIIRKYGLVVGAGDGYDICVLFNTLERYGIEYNLINYVNAKSLCRKGLNELSYSFDWLCNKYLSNYIEESDTEGKSNSWAKLTSIALAQSNEVDINTFCKNNKIRIGHLSPLDFSHSIIIRTRKSKGQIDINKDIVVEPNEESPFFEMSVVFTGKMEHITRIEARKLILEIGGYAPEILTTSTDFLVVGTQDMRVVGESGLSGKMKKAASYKEKGFPIEIINENDFIEMIGLK